jgi:hypothetical protein
MTQEPLTARGFALRVAAALLLVFVTFNPSGYSYWHWLSGSFPQVRPLPVLVGVALLIGWIIYVSATVRSLGTAGVTLLVAFFGAAIWAAADYHLLDLRSGHVAVWVALTVAGIILGAGMCWSHLRRRLTGQTDVEEVDHH